jgi:hypothetical protein
MYMGSWGGEGGAVILILVAGWLPGVFLHYNNRAFVWFVLYLTKTKPSFCFVAQHPH